MPQSLSHLVYEAPPTNPDTVANSCSEEESDEEIPQPKPLSGRHTIAGPSRYAASGPSRISGGVTPRRVEDDLKAQATVGRGGKLVYQATRPNAPVWYYTIQWRKPQFKKHKTWDGDAFLKVEGSRISMIGETGDHMATSALIGGLPSSGLEMRIGQYEVEVDNEITAEEFKSSTCILNKPTPKALPMGYAPSTFAKPFKPPSQTQSPRPSAGYIPAKGYVNNKSSLNHAPDVDTDSIAGPSRSTSSSSKKAISMDSFYAQPPKPRGDKIVLGEKSKKRRMEWGGALHDPNAEGAVVMQRPSEKEAKQKGMDIVDVVLDPFLTSKMRAHQKEGVKFMYSCVMGLTGAEANGCILADEMGLGKTLQTIALIHTLIKQSPFANESSVIGKALVVCPVSLVENWRKEFRKWIRPDQLSVVSADVSSDHSIKAFTHHRAQHVLIIGYERLRKVIKQLASCQPPIDLIICDEGHRLKSKDNKTTKMFESLRTRRRIILSGTPVQNDLGEYFAMVDFTCPGLLGTYPAFVKHYEKPILKSRTPGCSEVAVEEGRQRADELNKLSKEFVLRRTASVLDHYLPPKHEYVVFVAPSNYQLKAYAKILNPELMSQVLRGETDKQPLGYIDLMRKIANTPTILRFKKTDETSRSEHLVQVSASALKEIPSDMNTYDVRASGKLFALDRMLHALYTGTTEKIVVVSNFTLTLNVIQEVCKAKRYPFLRLDGQTPQKQRQDIVDQFNKERREESFVFLLSAKAGGVGLNLIGASRLVLFDSDWNPSTDLQAMARIHRDGQKKAVYIYRFLTTNSIDEKIYQRQIIKTGLADQMMDQSSNQETTRDSFTAAELRDIFRVNLHTDGCQTHDLLICDCSKTASSEVPVSPKESEITLSDNEDDEELKGFMPATQFDPDPTPKMLKKTAIEQREKLAALKAWTHVDGFEKTSFTGLADTILYNMMWEDWDRLKLPLNQSVKAAQSTDDFPGIDMMDDVDSDGSISPPPKGRKKPKRLASDLFPSDDEDEEFDSALAGALEKERQDKVLDSEGEDTVSTPSKRKSTSGSTSKTSSRSSSVRPKRGSKRPKSDLSITHSNNPQYRAHNLEMLANGGQTGRVMFVFERISKSKM